MYVRGDVCLCWFIDRNALWHLYRLLLDCYLTQVIVIKLLYAWQYNSGAEYDVVLRSRMLAFNITDKALNAHLYLYLLNID